ncbi:MAG: nitrous oxide reductase accessory protein NosL [Verrucomicrobiia bacterium]
MKKLIHKNLLWLASLALVVTGCNQQTALVPPKIHYGLETCADCGMIINDPHYAAALAWHAAPDGPTQSAVFDDIGCLLNWHRHHADAKVLATWVKNVRTAAWLDATSAIYVKSKRLQTPMGWGIAAGATTNDFSELPVHQPPLTWAELLKSGAKEVQPAALANQEGRND